MIDKLEFNKYEFLLLKSMNDRLFDSILNKIVENPILHGRNPVNAVHENGIYKIHFHVSYYDSGSNDLENIRRFMVYIDPIFFAQFMLEIYDTKYDTSDETSYRLACSVMRPVEDRNKINVYNPSEIEVISPKDSAYDKLDVAAASDSPSSIMKLKPITKLEGYEKIFKNIAFGYVASSLKLIYEKYFKDMNVWTFHLP